MDTFVLVKPSEEYMDEIRAYRQSFIDYDSEFNGDSGLKKFENITTTKNTKKWRIFGRNKKDKSGCYLRSSIWKNFVFNIGTTFSYV